MSLTPAQEQALRAQGATLVLAGAGTGKTRTMIARCVNRLLDAEDPIDLDQILMVTFTEAAAAEMKRRIAGELQRRLADTPSLRVEEQLALLDTAKIGTLHSFALDLIREHPHELDLAAGLRVLSPQETLRFKDQALTEVLNHHYARRDGDSAVICRSIRETGQGNDQMFRTLMLKVYHYQQSLARPSAWHTEQWALNQAPEPSQWHQWLQDALPKWIAVWLPALRSVAGASPNLDEALETLESLAHTLSAVDKEAQTFPVETLPPLIHRLLASDQAWPRGTKTRLRGPLEGFFADIQFLASLFAPHDSTAFNPLKEDWQRSCDSLQALLQVTHDFAHAYSQIKRQAAGLDFQDLEQFALDLLYQPDRRTPSPIADRLQERYQHVFVDEYQDINRAQDAIIRSFAGRDSESNLFIVGDVKQSIYRFRLANPEILRSYEDSWPDQHGADHRVYLQANFRSHPGVIQFVNKLCESVAAQVPGFRYEEEAHLVAGISTPEEEADVGGPPIEAHFILKAESGPDLPDSHLSEIHHIAARIHELRHSGTTIPDPETQKERPLRWSDFAILLRSISGRISRYAQVFREWNIPLEATSDRFFDLPEIRDLHVLLQVLDNPLQDIPLVALLRSPFCGFSPEELATVRIHHPKGAIWKAIQAFGAEASAEPSPTSDDAPAENGSDPLTRQTRHKCQRFLELYEQWQLHARSLSIAERLEQILAQSYYLEYQSSLFPNRNPSASVKQLIALAREFEQQAQASLTHFLRWIDHLQRSDQEWDASPNGTRDAVRLMTIHKSKGLEFPIVIFAELAKRFNTSDLSHRLIIDDQYGLCPVLHLPGSAETYPSLPHWLSQQKQREELTEEEARLLYVALTRTQSRLILTGTTTTKKLEETWPEATATSAASTSNRRAYCYLDWIGPWFVKHADLGPESQPFGTGTGANVRWHLHPPEETPEPPVMAPAADATPALSQTETAENAVPLQRLEWEYPHLEISAQRAKGSISSLERQSQVEPVAPFAARQLATATGTRESAGKGRSRGLAYHRLLQFLPPEATDSVEQAQQAVAALANEGLIEVSDVEMTQLEPVMRFWQSEVGQAIRSRQQYLHRELPFTARFTLTELDHLGFDVAESSPGSHEGVVIQGIIDLAVIAPEEIWLLDFKSEQLAPHEVKDRVILHAEQIAVYRSALQKTYRRPVTRTWIHFLQPGISTNPFP